LSGFVRRQLLPPRDVLNKQARHAGKPRARTRSGHCVGALARYGLRIARSAGVCEALR